MDWEGEKRLCASQSVLANWVPATIHWFLCHKQTLNKDKGGSRLENHSTMKTLQLNFWEKCSSNTASKVFLNEDNVSDGVPLNGIYAVFV